VGFYPYAAKGSYKIHGYETSVKQKENVKMHIDVRCWVRTFR